MLRVPPNKLGRAVLAGWLLVAGQARADDMDSKLRQSHGAPGKVPCKDLGEIGDSLQEAFVRYADRTGVNQCKMKLEATIEPNGRASEVDVVTDTCPSGFSAFVRETFFTRLRCEEGRRVADVPFDLVFRLDTD